MRFEEVYFGWSESRLSQEAMAEYLKGNKADILVLDMIIPP